MLEVLGIISLIISIVDLYLKNGAAMDHFLVGMILIVASMIIKSHSEIVQIRKYIGDYKRYTNQEKIDYKEDIEALKDKVEED